MIKMSGRKIVWVGLFPPENPSVGDHSQILAIRKWFTTYFPNHEVIRFYRRYAKPPIQHPTEGIRDWNGLLQTVKEDDLIFIHSSGDFGTLFYWTGMVNRSWHDFRRKLVRQFPNNRIVQLPVTVFYHNNAGGQATLRQNGEFYRNKTNVVLMCREPVSHKNLAQNLQCKTLMVPDFAFSLNPKLTGKERKGALLVLRFDHETAFGWVPGRLSKGPRFLSNVAHVQRTIKQVLPDVTVKDVNIYKKRLITDENREEIIRRVIDYYGSFKVVVTDRLHGMIFSVLSSTPCVCISGRIPHKISGYKSLVSDSVKFVDRIGEVPNAIRTVLSKPFQEVDLTSHFTTLKEKVT